MGVLRTVLALMVMINHLAGVFLGHYALFGFYIISGYLMTLIMHESYGYTSDGRTRFAVNRFLRLYPQYWTAVLFSILVISFLGWRAARYEYHLFMPTSWEWFQNISMIFVDWHPFTLSQRLVPSAWTLTIELCFYFLICLGISKTFNRVLVWLGLSVVYFAVTYLLDLSWQYRYSYAASASLPFAIGALIYFLPKIKLPTKGLFLILMVNSVIGALMFREVKWYFWDVGFYLNILICGLLVYSIKSGGQLFFTKIDQWIGDFSYPVYLLHWQVGALMSYLVFGHTNRGFNLTSFIVFLVSLVFIYGLSSLFIKYIDQPIQNIRAKVKHGKLFWRPVFQ